MRYALILICALVLLQSFDGPDPVTPPGPDPEPAPLPVNPDVPEDLVQSVKAALADSPRGTAEKYAGWFLAVGDTLEGDRPIRELRSAWIEARKTFELPGVLSKVVKRQMEPFEEGEIDRDKYAEAWDELAAACVEAAK